MARLFRIAIGIAIFAIGSISTAFAQGTCEINSGDLDSVRNVHNFENKKVGTVRLVARLGRSETNLDLNKRRLFSVTEYLVAQGVTRSDIVSEIGDPSSDLGDVKVYVAGKLQAQIEAGKNADIPVGMCDHDAEDKNRYQLPIEEPVPVGESCWYACECVRSALDAFVMETVTSPGKHGYAIVRGPQKDVLTMLEREGWIKGNIPFRIMAEKYDEKENSRFHIIRGGHSKTLSIEFYTSDPSNKELLGQISAWDLTLSLKKPLLYLDNHYNDPGGLCGAISYEPIFMEILRNNPNLYGQIVIKAKTRKEFWQHQSKFLARNKSADASQLRFVFKKGSRGYSDNLVLVPGRKPPRRKTVAQSTSLIKKNEDFGSYSPDYPVTLSYL